MVRISLTKTTIVKQYSNVLLFCLYSFMTNKITNLSILYPFIIIGPSLLFIGLAMHALHFIKTNTISSLLVIIGAPAVGFSFFVLKNGTYMVISCILFALGLILLLYRKENNPALTE